VFPAFSPPESLRVQGSNKNLLTLRFNFKGCKTLMSSPSFSLCPLRFCPVFRFTFNSLSPLPSSSCLFFPALTCNPNRPTLPPLPSAWERFPLFLFYFETVTFPSGRPPSAVTEQLGAPLPPSSAVRRKHLGFPLIFTCWESAFLSWSSPRGLFSIGVLTLVPAALLFTSLRAHPGFRGGLQVAFLFWFGQAPCQAQVVKGRS